MRTVLAIALGVVACGPARAPEATTVTTTKAPTPRSTRIDDRFREYEKKLPEPETLSEGNGATLDCEHHGYATYTLLAALAEKLAIARDDELLDLVPWARSKDPCLRQIAIEAIVTRIKFDRDRLSAPGMHEPEDHVFHEIFVSLRRYLLAHSVAFDAGIFGGMMLVVGPADFALLKGGWDEAETKMKNFASRVDYNGEHLLVTTHHVTPDPAWPDHTWTTKVKDVVVNERAQFVVTGEWDVESNANGYQGKKLVPSQFSYVFWPISAEIVWFDDGRGSFTKLRRRPG
jgi:hypothetical protein